MSTTTTYEIVIRGRATARFMRPLLDEFAVDHDIEGATRLIGDVRDAAHLHGIVAHLTSVGAELISIGPLTPAPVTTTTHTTTAHTTTGTNNESSNHS